MWLGRVLDYIRASLKSDIKMGDASGWIKFEPVCAALCNFHLDAGPFDKASGEKMGKLEKLGDLDWKPFESFIKSEQHGALPLDRTMITPASLARAPQLHEVYP